MTKNERQNMSSHSKKNPPKMMKKITVKEIKP